ncbi:tyrosine-type recombinase/integrase [Haloarcula sp. NS06]|uniref:tyrosine-type recombinase/integrase n=1 Tax=Haloarcula sp. NS06 TaxID=3409688 RepID=UPI003DA70010
MTFSSHISNIRRRAITGTQLKEGIRAGEVCNLRISEIHISHQELQKQYPELGTHPALGERRDVMYIPHDRSGNKSSNPRLLPIDDEIRWLLLRHLLTRPQVDEPWVFLSKRTFTQMTPQGVNDEWKEAFHPEYSETDDCAPVTSHYGRHWFSSFWRLAEGLEREQVQYLRGDRVQPIDDFPDAIDEYLHPNYELIEQTYRQNIFKFNISLEHAQF